MVLLMSLTHARVPQQRQVMSFVMRGGPRRKLLDSRQPQQAGLLSDFCTTTNMKTSSLFKRGTSVQQLPLSKVDSILTMPPVIYEDLSFAEHFTTCASKNLSKINENHEHVSTATVLEDIQSIFALKNRSISTLTVEKAVKKFIQDYQSLETEGEKLDILVELASKFYINNEELKAKALEISQVHEPEILMKKELELRNILEPPYNWLFSKIAAVSQNGVKFLSDSRADILTFLLQSNDLKNDQRLALKTMSGHLKDLLSHWFSAGLLELEQVTWQSPCSMLQKVSDYEAVHPVRSWTDLKSRVGPYRRCFVFTHKSMPGEPIVVLHVALTSEISASIASVVKHHRKVRKTSSVESEDMSDPAALTKKGSADTEDPALCTTAIFYSITSTQTGLQGIELGNSLIKQAVKKLLEEFPNMTQFSTLSPIPGFRNWLLKTLQMASHDLSQLLSEDEKERISQAFYGKTDDFNDSLFTALKSNQWAQNDKLRDALELPLMRLCGKYLFSEKRRNFALDPVANFHLRNGATLWRINWWADLSPRGLTNSCGIMVNYRYYLDKLEDNSTKYQELKDIDASEQVKLLATQAANVKKKD